MRTAVLALGIVAVLVTEVAAQDPEGPPGSKMVIVDFAGSGTVPQAARQTKWLIDRSQLAVKIDYGERKIDGKLTGFLQVVFLIGGGAFERLELDCMLGLNMFKLREQLETRNHINVAAVLHRSGGKCGPLPTHLR